MTSKRKLTRRQIGYAKAVIATMRAFLKGQPIQTRGKYATKNKWKDFDLLDFINNEPMEYRVKPKGSK